jgi:hypothetical protein
MLVPAPVLAGLLFAGCGDDPASVTCGAGTEQVGSECVAVEEAAGGSNGSAMGVGPSADAGEGNGPEPTGPQPPEFEGIASTAPASDVSVQVTWQPAEDASTPSSDITYRVYAATKSGQQNFGKPTVTSPPGVTTVLVGNLEPDRDYYFVVRAVDADGLEDANEEELIGTPELDGEAPEFEGVADGTAVGASSVQLSWSPASDDKTPAAGISYVVRWGTSPEGAAIGTVGAQSIPGATSVVVDGLPAPATKFYFTVSAQDAAGNSEPSSVALGIKTGDDVTPPLFGGCTGATDPGATTALVSWLPAHDDTTTAAAMVYNVYAFTKAIDEDTAFGNPAGTFVGGQQGRVEGLLAGTTYNFVCRAADISGNEDENVAFRVLETKSDGEPPEFEGIVGAVTDSTTAVLSWNGATDPGDQTPANEITYLVYQSKDAATVFDEAPVAISNPGATNIKLSDLDSATEYFWGVRARDKALNIDENDVQLTGRTLVSLALDIQPILSRYCAKSGCHGSTNPPQGLNMDVGSAYFNLVSVTAIEAPALKRIQPGDTALSYMVHKLEGTQATVGGSGQQMPPVGNEVPSLDNIALIKQWITEGAGQN